MTGEEAIIVLNMVEAHGLADEAKRIAIEALKQKPKSGHWYVNEWGNITCSECGCTALYDKVYSGESVFGKAIRVKTIFCPTCGAKMEK